MLPCSAFCSFLIFIVISGQRIQLHTLCLIPLIKPMGTDTPVQGFRFGGEALEERGNLPLQKNQLCRVTHTDWASYFGGTERAKWTEVHTVQ